MIRVSAYRWYEKRWNNDLCYARGNVNGESVLAHRFIMDAPDDVLVDHRNGNGLDCQKHNMRLCSHSQNSANKRRTDSFCGYKGVRYLGGNRQKHYYPRITVGSKTFYFGCTKQSIHAARIYNEAAKILFGEFACLNVVPPHSRNDVVARNKVIRILKEKGAI